METRVAAQTFHRTLPPTLAARLAACRVVLVEPSHPGNVGACARAMAAMGLSDLIVTGAAAAALCADRAARAHATAAAQPLLERARAAATLSDAIADCQLVVAVSAEARPFGPVPQPPGAIAQAALSALGSGAAERIGFVFGPERTGLSTEAVARCHWLATIPAEPAAASLNLAQAVQIIAFALRQQALAEAAAPAADPGSGHGAAPRRSGHAAAARRSDHAAAEALLCRLERTLIGIGALDPAAPRRMMPRLRRLCGRAGLEAADVDLLHGVLNRIDALISRPPVT
ncbi:MAG: RNA methyltransferase [Lautropia sp.]